MKIVILGGAGAMAEVALDELAKEAGVEKVTIADYNAAAAGEKAKKYGEKFDSVFIDATKPETITSLVKNYDVAMGFIGPFYQFEAKIAKACIDAGTHYVSISDDYDAYLAVEKLFDEAKKAGVTVISGLGNSPGITNILAKKAYYSMDKPEKINIHWTGGSDETVGAANVKHVMHIFEGHTLQWMDGKEVWVKTGEGEKVVEFPQPIGVNTVFYTGHAESVSVPRNLKGLKEVTLHGGTKPVWISRFATVMGKLRLTDTPKKRQTLAQLFEPVLGLFATGGVDKKRLPNRRLRNEQGSSAPQLLHRGRPYSVHYKYSVRRRRADARQRRN